MFNPRVFAEQQHRSWDAIVADMEQADAALRNAVEGSSESDLGDPERFPWREGLPLWTTALVSGYEHPAEHYAQFYRESGDVARAGAARRQVVDTARRFIGDTKEFGYIVYNLACFYAQIDQPDLAIAALRDAFAGVPSLRNESREDAELVSLQEHPAFQALVAETVDTTEGVIPEVGTSKD